MAPSLLRLLTAFLFVCPFFASFSQTPTSPIDPRDTLRILAEQERLRTQDPATGTVPYERLDAARQQINRQQATTNGAPSGTNGAIPNVTWQERGPGNAGGRTRALLFDPNDATHKKVWAGSPAGGLWYTNDITDINASWTPVSDLWENTVVTALAADPTNPQVMYAGTGDAYNNGGVQGGGIWKTTNGGTNWTRLSSTIPGGSYPSVSVSFLYIQRIVVNGSGHLYAASKFGVIKSTDGGNSWSYSLAPAQSIGIAGVPMNPSLENATDLEISSDGFLYAAFYGSKLYKSANGTTWTEITPPGTTGDRTELALAPSTSGAGQVIYGVSRLNNNTNYSQDIKWFKKSTDGGTTWTDLTIPAYGSSHFTSGSGYYYLNLSVHPTDPNTVYAGGYGWYKSINGGTSWSGTIPNTYQYQQGLWFQPGSGTAAALATENGVFWSVNWGDNTPTNPTIINRNTGFQIGEVYSVSMKNFPGSSFLLAGVRNSGFHQLNAAGLSTGTRIYGTDGPYGTFVDSDQPTLQILQSYSTFLRYNPTSSVQLTALNGYTIPTPSDYDSQSNILYAVEQNYTLNQSSIRRISGVDTTPQSTTLSLPGITNTISYLKISADRAALFVGNTSGKVYRITNIAQSTPTVTAIDNGALPQNASISCIDVGADDNELLVTLSNYGVQSVWYTSNGGAIWTGKDQSNFGLPDVPVRTALFDPTNRQQVLLGTDAGIWSTDNITTANPSWTYTGGGMGPFRINQLRYRPSDGRVTAATNGRGVWQSDALAVPYTLPTVAITGISNATLCAGNTFAVSFSTSGPAFNAGNTFDVWLSDANGNFASQKKIGNGATSPVSVTLPTGSAAQPYGTNYQVKIIAANPEVESGPSSALAIGNLGSASAWDRLDYSGNTICSGSRATLHVIARDVYYNTTIADGYQWSLNGTPISGAISQTVTAQQAGNYQASVRQAGCTIQSGSYNLYLNNSSSYIVSAAGNLPQCTGTQQVLRGGYVGETAAYQWTRDRADITGATTESLTATQTGSYSFRIVDGNCTVTAEPKRLTFGSSLYAVAERYPAVDSVLCNRNNTPIYMEVSQSSSFDRTTASFQWYRDNVLISGANGTSYSAYQPGIYSFGLTQGNC